MSTPSQLSIFPSPPKQRDPKSKQPQLRDVTRNSTELRGLALHFVAAAPKIQQANETVQHAPFADRSSQDHSSQTSRLQHKRPKPSTPNLRTVVEASNQQSSSQQSSNLHPSNLESEHCNKPALRSALKTSSMASSTAYSKRISASTTLTSPVSALIETPATNYSIHSLDKRYEHTTTASQHSGSYRAASTEIKRDGAASAPPEKMNRPFPPRSQSLRSGKTSVSDIHDTTVLGNNRSIFPQYDPTKPLSRQQYYPPRAAASSSSPPMAPTHDSIPKPLERKDSGLALPRNYECIPEPDYEDIHSLWRASTRLGACGGRKVQLSFRQIPGSDNAYAIGGACRLFSARIDKPADNSSPSVLSIEKINPTDNEKQPLSDMSLPPMSRSQPAQATCKIPIFPHQAAVDALTAASNSPQAMAIAQFDPQATSRAAETLAKEAVADAHEHYTSELIRTTRARDSIGTVSASYRLKHPIASELAITVARSVPISRIYTSQTPQVKVTIHHPSATPAAIDEDSLALASIDFGRKTCIIDLPGILALEAEYMLDTAIAALYATAAMESDQASQQVMTFAAPPTSAVKEPKKKRSVLRKAKKEKSSSSGLWSLRRTGVREIDDPVEEMPSMAKGALAIIELGINGAFWALEKGFKSLDERAAARS